MLWVDPAEIPADADITALAAALAAGAGGYRGELMANTTAYAGLRWGELTALTTGQADTAARVIAVDRKVVEVAGHLYVEPPKNRKKRATIYPRRTPAGYPLADKLAARIEQARAEQEAGANPLGLVVPFCWYQREARRRPRLSACGCPLVSAPTGDLGSDGAGPHPEQGARRMRPPRTAWNPTRTPRPW